MTPQELASSPQGTRVRILIEDVTPTEDGCIERLGQSYGYGTIGLPGVVTHVAWEDGPTTLIDTKSKVWEGFIGEMELA